MNPPEIAVVISTRDRPDQVRRALLSVLACDYPALSVVVVDQSRGPDTMVALDRWADHRRVRILTDGRPGLARGRNRGIEAASADLVAFTDDDCVVARDWPAALAAAFDRCGAAALVFGSVHVPAYDRSQGFIVGYEPPHPTASDGSDPRPDWRGSARAWLCAGPRGGRWGDSMRCWAWVRRCAQVRTRTSSFAPCWPGTTSARSRPPWSRITDFAAGTRARGWSMTICTG